jgi:hypothetical protein
VKLQSRLNHSWKLPWDLADSPAETAAMLAAKNIPAPRLMDNLQSPRTAVDAPGNTASTQVTQVTQATPRTKRRQWWVHSNPNCINQHGNWRRHSDSGKLCCRKKACCSATPAQVNSDGEANANIVSVEMGLSSAFRLTGRTAAAKGKLRIMSDPTQTENDGKNDTTVDSKLVRHTGLC